MEIHQSAHNHGIDDEHILHAIHHALEVVDLDLDAEPSKVLVLGPDTSGNLLEIIWLEFNDERILVIHAMPMRRVFHDLLTPWGDES